MTAPARTAGPTRWLAAWGVHVFTAAGALAGFLALAAIHGGRYTEAFAWMAVALVIDSADGTLARLVGVKSVLPGFDGTRLDDIVDFLNYTVVPMALITAAGRLPAGLEHVVAGAVLLASAYGFCQTDAKTADGFFKGFPSYWNVVVFYLFVLETPPAWNAAVLLLCAVLVFVPSYYVYPSRTQPLRAVTIVLGIAWAASAVAVLVQLPDPPRALVIGSASYLAYYMGLSAYLTLRR
jgi:phosphatidylcholine synthase